MAQTKELKKQEQNLEEQLGIGKGTKECQQTIERQLPLVTISWFLIIICPVFVT